MSAVDLWDTKQGAISTPRPFPLMANGLRQLDMMVASKSGMFPRRRMHHADRKAGEKQSIDASRQDFTSCFFTE